MNSRQGLALWRRRHQRAFYASCLVAGGLFGALVPLVPQPFFSFVMLPVTLYVFVAAARLYRQSRKFDLAFQRLQRAAEQHDEAAFEAALLDLALLLPSARKSRTSSDGSHEALE